MQFSYLSNCLFHLILTNNSNKYHKYSHVIDNLDNLPEKTKNAIITMIEEIAQQES